MAITPEQARAELERRKRTSAPSVTPEQARAELQRRQPQAFKFNVPDAPKERENRIGQYQAETQQSEAESKKANSFLGKTANFFKAAGGMIASSEVALGQTISKILNIDSKSTRALNDAQAQRSGTSADLLKNIREKESRGEDATRLQQEYNRLTGDKSLDNAIADTRNLPTTGQVVGQLAGTALDLLTAGTYGKVAQGMKPFSLVRPGSAVKNLATGAGLPELGPLATQKAGGLFTMKGAGNILKGAGIGYAADVTQGLQGARGEDRTGGRAFIPGLGTALGTTIPAISETHQSFANRASGAPTVNKRYIALNDLESKNGKIAKVFRAGDKKGVDVRKVLSETNLLNGAVDGDGRISSALALDNFNEVMKPWEGQVRQRLEQEGRVLNSQELSRLVDDFVQNSNLPPGKAREKITEEITDELRALMNGKTGVPLTDLHDVKVFRQNQNNYMDTTANVVNKQVARFFKEAVEKSTKALDVETYNRELGKLNAVRDALEAMDRAVVKGGRAGKYFSTTVGGIIGGSSGNPLLAILGAELGNQAQSMVLRNALGGDIQKGLEPSADLLGALAPKAGKAAIPDVTIPKPKTPFGELNLQSSLSQTRTRQANSPSATSPSTNPIPKTILPVKEASTPLSPSQKKAKIDSAHSRENQNSVQKQRRSRLTSTHSSKT